MHSKKINITFIIPSLIPGGAERILSFVAKNIDREKFNPTLLVIGFAKNTVYELDDLNVIYLNKTRVIKSVFPLISYFRKEKPQIVLSSIFHLNTLIAFLSLFFPKIKFVAREANVLSALAKHGQNSNLNGLKLLIVTAYKLIDCLICQSKDMQQDMVNNFGVTIDKTVLINNPITSNNKPKETNRDITKPLKIITVGRLSKEKGHKRIIEVLAKLTFPFQYYLIGDGLEKEELLALIQQKGITNFVTHIPYTKDVDGFLRQSDVFLQGSYSEGFPNALIESCVVGTPIIAFNAPGGINEIIEPGENGFIINSIEECVEKLTQLNTDFVFSPKRVNQIVTERFNSEKIIGQYEDLFLKLTNNYDN